jgi:hypothetical protein
MGSTRSTSGQGPQGRLARHLADRLHALRQRPHDGDRAAALRRGPRLAPGDRLPVRRGQLRAQRRREALESFAETGGGGWTLVWLPSFFSDGVEKLLGELVRLEAHPARAARPTREYLHGPVASKIQSRALIDLEQPAQHEEGARARGAEPRPTGWRAEKEGDLDTGAASHSTCTSSSRGPSWSRRCRPTWPRRSARTSRRCCRRGTRAIRGSRSG